MSETVIPEYTEEVEENSPAKAAPVKKTPKKTAPAESKPKTTGKELALTKKKVIVPKKVSEKNAGDDSKRIVAVDEKKKPSAIRRPLPIVASRNANRMAMIGADNKLGTSGNANQILRDQIAGFIETLTIDSALMVAKDRTVLKGSHLHRAMSIRS